MTEELSFAYEYFKEANMTEIGPEQKGVIERKLKYINNSLQSIVDYL